MKRLLLILSLSLALLLPGCGTAQTAHSETAQDPVYHSDLSRADCYLCGDRIRQLLPHHWGQDNIALISLNTFEIVPIEINRYDRTTGQPVEEPTGKVLFGGAGGKNGAFLAALLLNSDRGYADGTLYFHEDEVLDAGKAAKFLCADCMNAILPQETEQCLGVAAIHLRTEEIRVFETRMSGFFLGDFYIDYTLQDRFSHQMSFLAFYCPVRYS